MNDNTPDNLLDTLKITKIQKRPVGGSWITGTIGGHAFEALVFPELATNPAYEIPGSNISKLWLADARREVVAEFDRGWNRQPSTDAAKQIVDLLAAGLAEHIFG